MRRFMLVCALLASGLFSLVVLVVSAPLLAVMRANRRERNAQLLGEIYPYDDNDAGTDVDVCEGCGNSLGHYGCDVCDDDTDYTRDADIGGEA